MEIFKENMINDLYRLCFQNYIVHLVNISGYKKEQCKLHRSLLDVRGGGESDSEQPSLQHLAVMVKINIFRPNFS